LEEPVNNLDQAKLAWAEQVKEFFDTIQKLPMWLQASWKLSTVVDEEVDRT
jgi:hypothetical protein